MKDRTEAYRMFRQAGMRASQASHAAKAYCEFRALELKDLVKLRADHEVENYFDVYGEPEGYTNTQGNWVTPEQERKEICDSIDRNGCYCVIAEYWDGKEWHHADSVGMCAGYSNVLSPTENWYVPDLMRSAVDKANAIESDMADLRDFCPTCGQKLQRTESGVQS